MSVEANSQRSGRFSGRTVLVFLGVAVVWFCLDMITKGAINGTYEQGEVITGPILGLVRLHLVYNTGAAWGMFGDSTQMLAIMSLVVCIVLTAYLFFLAPRPGLLETTGVALVVAGGLGNAVDRFTLGYVVDFIEPVFIDFPIFNVADIGVTCGFVLFVLGMFLEYRRADKETAAACAAVSQVEASGNDEALPSSAAPVQSAVKVDDDAVVRSVDAPAPLKQEDTSGSSCSEEGRSER